MDFAFSVAIVEANSFGRLKPFGLPTPNRLGWDL